MASMQIPCPECGSILKLPDRSLLGKKGRCPSCRHTFVLAEPEEEVEDDASDVISAEEAIAHLSAARPVSRKEVIDYDKTTDSDLVFGQKHSQFKNTE